MKKGDLVKHKHGTLQGQGLVLSDNELFNSHAVLTLWTAHGTSRVQQVATQYLEVISESR